jgi:hypothetical protein
MLAVIALVAFQPLGAFGDESGDGSASGQGTASTQLTVSVDKTMVFAGDTVTVQGQLLSDVQSTPIATPPGDTSTVAPPLTLRFRSLCEGRGDAQGQDGMGQGQDENDGNDGQDQSDNQALAPVAGEDVAIMQSTPDGGWSQVATVTTGADGSFSAPVVVNGVTSLKAEYAGSAVYDSAESDEVAVDVFAAVTPPAPVTGAVGGAPFTVTGKAASSAGAVSVVAYRVARSGKLVKVVSKTAVTGHGRYSATLKLQAGDYRIAAKQAGTARVHGFQTKPRPLRVRTH